MSNLKFPSKIIDLFNEFKEKFGYEYIDENISGPYVTYVLYGYISFERHVDYDECTHTIVLENHTWELKDPDFNPKHDIGDWLIFSYRKNDGDSDNENDLQYPLTLSEYRFIERIIQALDAEFPREH